MAFSQTTGHQTSNTVIGPVAEASQMILFRDEKAPDVGGGTFTSGAWQTRDLNTVVTDETGEASLSTNQFTLPAGSYRFWASSPAAGVNNHQTRLQNITAGTTVIEGESTYADAAGDGTEHSVTHGVFVITAPTIFELQHRCTTTKATNGFGAATGHASVEVYASISLLRVNPPFTTLPGQQKLIVIREEVASGVASGTFTSGDWRTRAVNTIAVDETGGVSISSDQFTLPAGTYRVSAKAEFFGSAANLLRLQNITDAETTLFGLNDHCTVAANSDGHACHLGGLFTITAAKTFELQQRCGLTQTSNGFGVAHSFGVNEVYVHMEFLKVA